MPKYLLSTSEVIAGGIPRYLIKRYLEPVYGSKNNPIRIGREYAYMAEEVREAKKKIERDMQRERKTTLFPEDLTTKQRKRLLKKAVAYSVIKIIQGDMTSYTEKKYKSLIGAIMGTKERYDDGIVKISHGWETQSNVDVQRLSHYIGEDVLERKGIIEKIYRADVLERKGAILMKPKIDNIVKSFEVFCGKSIASIVPSFWARAEFSEHPAAYEKVVRNFYKEERIRIPLQVVMRILKDWGRYRLTERRKGEYARELVSTCITKTPKTRKFRVTLSDKQRTAIKKILETEGMKKGVLPATKLADTIASKAF